ncbi:MAG: hypothetical protein Metus_1570 [Candidatus Methanosuratincola subterraneus]|uniref:Uncharacterized protein n=1 Tax=Methanosuratincola subterraneus TaxID=2593994 RepID=A0A3S3SQR7_METS7|nr:MAG: hypothetical protein Metus_1570 [Candidatus Methanosuratincola subterraneus]
MVQTLCKIKIEENRIMPSAIPNYLTLSVDFILVLFFIQYLKIIVHKY